MKRVAILQSNYIPWKGYFDIIANVDEFIFYDDMQFTKRDWRNRNQVRAPQEAVWLTVPVKVKGKYFQAIKETEIDYSTDWARKHWLTIESSYKRSPHFSEIEALLKPLYQEKYFSISDLNVKFVKKICGFLDIKTKLSMSSDYQVIDGKTERLVDLCVKAGATEYVSGPAAKDYIVPGLFSDVKIKLLWFQYDQYPEYQQLWDYPFSHFVSVVDLLMMQGKNSRSHLKGRMHD